MRDHRGQVHGPGAEHGTHLVPRGPQAAADDAVDGDPLEDDAVVEVEGDGAGEEAQEGRLASGVEEPEALVDGRSHPGHLQEYVDAVAIGGRHDLGFQVDPGRVEHRLGAHRPRHVEAVVADIGGQDGAGAEGAGGARWP